MTALRGLTWFELVVQKQQQPTQLPVFVIPSDLGRLAISVAHVLAHVTRKRKKKEITRAIGSCRLFACGEHISP